MGSLISVIIPCYNVETFLDRTLDAIANQEYKDLDIVLVNDGSTDMTGTLCDKWAKRDQRIQVVHQKNHGVSHARNTGISIARGEYLTFVDADDLVHPEMIKRLYDLSVDHGAQITACLLAQLYEGSSSPVTKDVYVKEFKTKDAIESALKGKELSCSVTGKLFTRKLFNNTSFRVGVIYEDAFIVIELILRSDKVVFTNEKLYGYYHREGSIIHSGFTMEHFDVVEAHLHNRNLVVGKFPQLEFVAEQRLSWAYLTFFDRLILANHIDKEYRRSIRQEIVGRFRYIRKGKYFRIGRKLAVFVLHFSIPLYKLMVIYRYKSYAAHEQK